VLRRIFPVIMVLFMLVMDCTVLPMLATGSLMPLLTLLTVHSLGLLLGRSSGALYGLIAGLLMDVLVSTPLGLMTSLYTAMGYLGGWFAHSRLRYPLIPLVSGLMGFAAYELVQAAYVILASGQISGRMFLDAGVRVLIHAAATQAMCWVYGIILRPAGQKNPQARSFRKR